MTAMIRQLKDRNKSLTLLYKTNPNITMAEIGKMFGITKQRVSFLIRRYKSQRNCENCLHYQEFKVCSCRDKSELVVTANKCPDWMPEGTDR
jgi:predicted transcriptional regulator